MFPFIRTTRNLIRTNHETAVSMVRAFGANVETTRVVIKVLYGELVRLPHTRGLMTLTLEGLPTIADGTLPVYLSDGRMTKALLLPSGENMPASEFTNGEHILFCYNKQDSTIRVVSSEALPTTSTTPAAGGTDAGADVQMLQATSAKTTKGS